MFISEKFVYELSGSFVSLLSSLRAEFNGLTLTLEEMFRSMGTIVSSLKTMMFLCSFTRTGVSIGESVLECAVLVKPSTMLYS